MCKQFFQQNNNACTKMNLRQIVSEILNVKSKETFYDSEYAITQQYLKRALRRAY